ncbi:MAG: hypothetical protein ABR576_02050 [Thermoanaerobaculia bacterium]
MIADPFDTNRPGICPMLRWKNQFVLVERGVEPASHEGLFWCLQTQTCIGPDGGIAEPEPCSTRYRECYGGVE